MSFIHHAIAKKIKEDKEKDKMVREVLYLAVVLMDYVSEPGTGGESHQDSAREPGQEQSCQ